MTPSYLRRLFDAVPGLNVSAALSASQAPSADNALKAPNTLASSDGIAATPSFLIGKAGGALRRFQPSALSPAPFAAAVNQLLGASR